MRESSCRLKNRSDFKVACHSFLSIKTTLSHHLLQLSNFQQRAKFCDDKCEFRDISIVERGGSVYLKMLIQAVGVPIFELPGALASRGGLRLLHPWNTDSRAFGHATAEAVPESRQHGFPESPSRFRVVPAREISRLHAPPIRGGRRGRGTAFPTARHLTIAKMTTIAIRTPGTRIHKPSIIPVK